MTLGERILNYRALHGLTQKQAADRLEVGAHVIQRLECGRNVHRARAIMLNAKLDKLENNEMED